MSRRNSLSSINEISRSALSSPVRLYGSPSKKKHVVPYSPRSPEKCHQSFFSSYSSPCKANNVNSPSNTINFKQFSPKKNRTISKAEFTSMLENPSPKSFKDSFLGQALFDLSIGLRSLDNVLKQILNFRLNAPLKYYSYTSLLSLINASSLCPPDAVLQLLSIGKVMITKHNYCKPQYLRALIKVTKYLISKNFFYVSYGKNMQDKPKRKLKRLLQIFTGFLDMPQIGPEGNYETSKIEDIMNKNRSFNDEKLEKEIQRRKRNKEMKIRELKDNNNLLDANDNFDNEYDKTEITGSFSLDSDLEDLIQSDKLINFNDGSDIENNSNLQNNGVDQKESKNDNDPKDDFNDYIKISEKENSNIRDDKLKEKSEENVKDKVANENANSLDENDYMAKSANNTINENDFANSLIKNNKSNAISEDHNDSKENENDDDQFTEEKDYLSNLIDNDIIAKENDNVLAKSDADGIETETDACRIKQDNNEKNITERNENNSSVEDDENLLLLEECNENSTDNDENLILGNNSEGILTENDDDLILENNEDAKSSNNSESDKKSHKENYIDTKIQTDDFGKNSHHYLYQDEKSQTDNDSGVYDDNFPSSDKNNNNEQRTNFEDYDKMSSRSWKSSLTESVQFTIDIEPESKNQSGESNIKLSQLEDSDPNIQSIERFIRSTDTLYERREKGKIRLDSLSPEQREKINVLAKLFNNWKTAYASSRVVWNTMKADTTFDVNILLSQIPVSYGDFLVEALTTFAQQEGIIIQKIESPL